MSEKIPSMDAPRFRPVRNPGGDVLFVPESHEVESVFSANEFEEGIYDMFAKIITLQKESEINALLAVAGEAIGLHIARNSQVKRGNTIYGLALFQGFLEKILLTYGMKVKSYFLNESFISGIAKGAAALSEQGDTMNPLRPNYIPEKITGAVSVYEYVKKIEQDERVVFIGSDTGLDTRHAIDLIVGYSNNPHDIPLVIDEVHLVQVKTKMPDDDHMYDLKKKHKTYLDGVQGIGVDVAVDSLAEGELTPRDATYSEVSAVAGFYSKLSEPLFRQEAFSAPITWESIVAAAEKYEIADPVCFYVYITTMNEDRIAHLTAWRQKKMLEFRDQIAQIQIPQSVLSVYTRMTTDVPVHSVLRASKIKSVLVADGVAKVLDSI